MSKKDEWVTIKPQDFESGEIWNYREDGKDSSIQGKFLGTKTGLGKNESSLHQLEAKDGLRDVWGAFVLDQRMKEVPRGAMCKITYLGKIASKKTGGNDYHSFDVQYKPLAEKKVEKKEEVAELPFDE